MQSVSRFYTDRLEVIVAPSRPAMGVACASESAQNLRSLLAKQESVSIIFASSPSQLEMLDSLRLEGGIDWSRVRGFIMDEYIGIPTTAPQSFGNYLRTHFFSKVPFRQVFYIDGLAPDPIAECQRYADLLRQYPVDISFVGIGENGHLAFNDPAIADFDDPLLVKINEDMDPPCREQQVTDGWFKTLDDVPHRAITITMSGLLAAKWMYACVPGLTKQKIVKRCLEGPVSTECPGSILRRHPAARLYLDPDSAALLDLKLVVAK
jgi:glucosamine-6-phosphate deaminase